MTRSKRTVFVGDRFSGTPVRSTGGGPRPEARIGRMALACLARFCPEAADVIEAAAMAEGDGHAQVAIPSSDGSGRRDTLAMNLRLEGGVLRCAVEHRGVEIGYRALTVGRTVPATTAAAMAGRPLGDLVDIGFPMPSVVTVRSIDLYEDEGMIIAYDDPGLPLPADGAAIARMVSDELARGADGGTA